MKHEMNAKIHAAAKEQACTSPRIYIGVATLGRAEILSRVVTHLRKQTLPATRILVACVDASDVSGIQPASDLGIIFSNAGSCPQRNAILQRLPPDADYVVFFDDDFVPDNGWLEACARIFETDPAVACVTGQVLADGILGPGLSFEQGEATLRDAPRRSDDWRIEGYSPYGCNMAFRVSAIAGLRFDERLPLYGWQEDRDFGAQVARRGGKLVKVGAAAGVHLGVKRGRVSGVRFGYSQIANPVYLWRKGTMTGRAMLRQMARNMAANLARAARPEPFIDRRGRLRGNALALVDLARGVCRPERAGSL